MPLIQLSQAQAHCGVNSAWLTIKMPNGQIITLSGAREPIKIGLLKAMLRKAGLSEEEFLRLMEGDS
jgi:hypothetical protein